jgi:hypothetical protein
MATEVPCKEVKKAPAWMMAVMLGVPFLIWAAAWLAAGETGFLGIGRLGRPTAFLVIIVLMTAFCFVVGKAVTGLWRGLLIDGRNWISLSRFQTVAWTIVVLSGILVAAFGNLAIQGKPGVQLPPGGPLDFEIPEEIWLVLGISVTSLVGSPLIRNNKRSRPANPDEVIRTEEALAMQGETMRSEGQILVRPCPEQATWGDLFQAEEVGNGAHLDLGKVQNFYFTLILVFAYGQALFTMFGKPPGVVAFPEMSGGMAALLAISHAAYLADKARSKSQPPPTGGAGGEVDTEAARSRMEAVAVERATLEAARTAPKPVATPPPPSGTETTQ